MTIADNIKKLREQYNISQSELGKIAGVTDKAVSTWENGIAEPRMGAVEKIAKHFNIPKSYIVDDDVEDSYYFDPEVAQMVEDLKNREGMRILFDATRDLSKEDIEFVVQMVEKMKRD